LTKISFMKTYRSEANYFLCQVSNKYSAAYLSEILIKNNIYIKDLTGKIAFEGKNYIRIAVRDKFDNDEIIRILKEMD